MKIKVYVQFYNLNPDIKQTLFFTEKDISKTPASKFKAIIISHRD